MRPVTQPNVAFGFNSLTQTQNQSFRSIAPNSSQSFSVFQNQPQQMGIYSNDLTKNNYIDAHAASALNSPVNNILRPQNVSLVNKTTQSNLSTKDLTDLLL